MATQKSVRRYGAFKGTTHKGYTITELVEMVAESKRDELGIDDIGGDGATGARIIEDLLAEIRRLNRQVKALTPK